MLILSPSLLPSLPPSITTFLSYNPRFHASTLLFTCFVKSLLYYPVIYQLTFTHSLTSTYKYMYLHLSLYHFLSPSLPISVCLFLILSRIILLTHTHALPHTLFCSLLHSQIQSIKQLFKAWCKLSLQNQTFRWMSRMQAYKIFKTWNLIQAFSSEYFLPWSQIVRLRFKVCCRVLIAARQAWNLHIVVTPLVNIKQGTQSDLLVYAQGMSRNNWLSIIRYICSSLIMIICCYSLSMVSLTTVCDFMNLDLLLRIIQPTDCWSPSLTLWSLVSQVRFRAFFSIETSLPHASRKTIETKWHLCFRLSGQQQLKWWHRISLRESGY